MSIAYRAGFVMFPPRPEGSVHPDDLLQYPGWWAQRKFNGTRTVIFIDPEGTATIKNRHKEDHRAYKLTGEMREAIRSLPLERGTWHVLDGELMHSKTKGLKDRIVVFDILVHDGEYLVGTTVKDRFDLLFYAVGEPDTYEDETGSELALRVNDNLWLAEMFDSDLPDRFRELNALDEIEGLVLKDPGGKMQPGVIEKNNTSWLIRCRKPHKNYQY